MTLSLELILEQISRRVNSSQEEGRAFFNFLSQTFPREAIWNPAWVTEFFSACMVYPHWQQRRSQLSEHIQQLLIGIQRETGWDLGLESVNWDLNFQIFELQFNREVETVLEAYLKRRYQPKDHYRIRILFDQDIFVGLVFNVRTQILEARLCDRKFRVKEGELCPLRENLAVIWDQELNLLENKFFIMDLGTYSTCVFRVNHGLVSYQLYRGFLFTPVRSVKSEPLETIPQLFYRLKWLENLFLKRDSNPFYTGLISEIERYLNWIKLKEPISKEELTELYIRARNAVEWVFKEDKLLMLLIKQLEQNLENSPSPWILSGLDFVDSEEKRVHNQSPQWRPDSIDS